MSLFSDKELEPHQIEKINDLLPDHLRKPIWKASDFKGSTSIYQRVDNILTEATKTPRNIESNLQKKKDELKNLEASMILIFNTEPYEATPFGMVDIGNVVKFGAATTGDRFAGGAIGYALESAIDESYTKGNIQENAVNEVKFELLKKAKAIYPNCNLLFKYQVDFREIGSSGNVFIYMRGTAASGKNPMLDQAKKEADVKINKLSEEISERKLEVKELQVLRAKIPRDKNEIKKLLD